jgi:hypothetical protein
VHPPPFLKTVLPCLNIVSVDKRPATSTATTTVANIPVQIKLATNEMSLIVKIVLEK